jgi:hypothetical protein
MFLTWNIPTHPLSTNQGCSALVSAAWKWTLLARNLRHCAPCRGNRSAWNSPWDNGLIPQSLLIVLGSHMRRVRSIWPPIRLTFGLSVTPGEMFYVRCLEPESQGGAQILPLVSLLPVFSQVSGQLNISVKTLQSLFPPPCVWWTASMLAARKRGWRITHCQHAFFCWICAMVKTP